MAAKLSSFWETAKQVPYEPEQASQSDNFWETAKQVPYESVNQPATAPNQPQDEKSLLESAYQAFSKLSPALRDSFNILVKAPLSGTAEGAIDSFTTPVNIATGLHNTALEQNSEFDAKTHARLYAGGDAYAPWVPKEQVEAAKLPYIPSASGAIEDLIDTATGGFSKDDNPGAFYKGVKAGASVAVPGSIGKYLSKGTNAAAQFGSKLLNSVGSTNKAVVAGAAAGGAAQEYARELGFGTGGQLTAGFGANAATQVLNPRNIAKATASAIGLGKNQLKMETVDAAERLGVDLLAAGASDSKLLAQANQQISKFPWVGDYLKDKYKKSSDQFQNAFKNLADTVGPELTDDIKSAAQGLYEQANKALPQNAFIVPQNTSGEIKNLFKTKATLIKNDKTKKLFEVLEEANDALQGGNIPIPIDMLVNTKVNVNGMIKWDSDSKGPLALIQKALNQDIAQYGKTNKEWYNQFQEAEKNFAKNAKRKSLDDIIAGKIQDPISLEVKYMPFVKLLTNPKYQNKIENVLGKGNSEKLQDFIEVARGMAQAERNTPNPSGSTPVAITAGLVTGIYGFLTGTVPLSAAASAAAPIAATTYLISSKSFLNKAADFARKPSEPLAKQLENIVKENTGYTIQALNKIYREKD